MGKASKHAHKKLQGISFTRKHSWASANYTFMSNIMKCWCISYYKCVEMNIKTRMTIPVVILTSLNQFQTVHCEWLHQSQGLYLAWTWTEATSTPLSIYKVDHHMGTHNSSNSLINKSCLDFKDSHSHALLMCSSHAGVSEEDCVQKGGCKQLW